MAQKIEYDNNANQAVGFSGFGGHSLTSKQDTAALSDGGASGDYLTKLASLGIEDAEQLVAIAAIPEVRGELETVLDLQDTSLDDILEQVKAPLPAEDLAQVSTPAAPEYGLGVLMPTPELLAAAEASAMNASEAAMPIVGLPQAINLIPYMSPMRNQGGRGTCVAFALTALNEYILRRKGYVRDLSEQHLYYETKLIDGHTAECGTWQSYATRVLLTRGECREEIWPYNPNPPCNNHGAMPAQARPDGLNYRLTTLAVPARSVADYKLHLSKQRPVTVSIPVYNSWYLSQESRLSGRITMRVGNELVIAGHAVCLVGYQDSASSPGGGYFIVRNQWLGWASKSPYKDTYGAGYGTIPYQYIANDAWEAYTAVVPGITSEDDDSTPKPDPTDETTGKSTVTISVGSNVKITIATT